MGRKNQRKRYKFYKKKKGRKKTRTNIAMLTKYHVTRYRWSAIKKMAMIQ